MINETAFKNCKTLLTFKLLKTFSIIDIFLNSIVSVNLMFVYLDGPITLMAPTDDAFNRLGNETVAKLLQNPTLLGGKFTTQMPLSIADELSSSSSSSSSCCFFRCAEIPHFTWNSVLQRNAFWLLPHS